MFRLSCLCFCSDSNLNLKSACTVFVVAVVVVDFFEKFNDENFVLVGCGSN